MLSDLLAARLIMAGSLGFHIILASIGMVMPFLMARSHYIWLKTGDADAYRLTRIWMRGVAIFFATGAVSGTALSFELGILWPTFMLHAGPIIGMPFSLEGAAFFVEAIAFGVYLYGWQRVPPRIHWWTGVIAGIAGMASGILVISANGWMNSPTGFRWDGHTASDIDPWAALFNPAWATQAVHMVVASVEAVGFAAAGVHALLYKLRADRIHLLGLKIALIFGAVAALAQPIVGHWAAQGVAERQPIKLAAMEAHFDTMPYAPIRVGGIPDEDSGDVRLGLEIPGLLSLLAFNRLDAVVTGLRDYPRDTWPPVAIVHFAFQLMVAIGTWLAMVGLFGLFVLRWRPTWAEHRRFVDLLVMSAPLGFVAIESGWVVTEVGRQPWIIYGIMRTAEAVTPVPGQVFHLAVFGLLYALIGATTILMWYRQIVYAHLILPPDGELRAWARVT